MLLDEPALTLHGRAQADFLRFINERLAPDSPVLYTTHSPFMVEAGRLERVRIVEDSGPPTGATATTEVMVADADSLFPLQAALGYDIAQSLFIGPSRPGGRCGWVQCRAMRRRCQRNSVSGVTSHPARLGRGSAAAIAPSKLRSASVSSGRSTWRRSTASWWCNTMISSSFQRPDRTVSRASDARNRYKIQYTRTQHRPASRHVNDHGRVSGTHRLPRPKPTANLLGPSASTRPRTAPRSRLNNFKRPKTV